MILDLETNKSKQIDNDNILFFIKTDSKTDSFDYQVKVFLKDGTIVQGSLSQEMLHDHRKYWLTFLQFQKLKENLSS